MKQGIEKQVEIDRDKANRMLANFQYYRPKVINLYILGYTADRICFALNIGEDLCQAILDYYRTKNFLNPNPMGGKQEPYFENEDEMIYDVNRVPLSESEMQIFNNI